MRLRPRYRNSPNFVLRRIDRAAGHVNAALVAIATGLAALDFIVAAQRIASALPYLPPAAPETGSNCTLNALRSSVATQI